MGTGRKNGSGDFLGMTSAIINMTPIFDEQGNLDSHLYRAGFTSIGYDRDDRSEFIPVPEYETINIESALKLGVVTPEWIASVKAGFKALYERLDEINAVVTMEIAPPTPEA